MKSVKVYCYFLKKSKNDLYAFTIDKSFKDLFESQRFMKNFISGEKVYTEIEYQSFLSVNKDKMLQKDYIVDEDKTFEMIVTNEESNKLTSSCEYISDFLMKVQSDVTTKKLLLTDTYLDSIFKMTEILKYDKDKNLNINTFKLFSYLFKDTLYEESSFNSEFSFNS